MGEKRKILFTYSDDPESTFIRQDIKFLQKWYVVEEQPLQKFGWYHAIFSPHFWKIVARNDAVFGWFGTSASAIIIGFLLRKPTIVVAGGCDVVEIPEIGYGFRRTNPFFLYMVLGYHLASKVLLFSDASRKDFLKILGTKTSNSQLLYLGVDTDYFRPFGEKKDQVLTICYFTQSNWLRKGLRTFVEVAKLLPDVTFKIAGKVAEPDFFSYLMKVSPPNLIISGNLSKEQLLKEYQESRIYAQLSLHEGFGMALVEAMACDCIPLVTNNGSLPEVVGDTGCFVPLNEPEDICKIIQEMLGNKSLSNPRQRVLERFSLNAREDGLKKVMEGCFMGDSDDYR